MTRIYAASLVASQGVGVPTVRLHLITSQDGDQASVTLEWNLPTPINPADNPGEWAYALLSRIVQDFDDHEVTKVEFIPFPSDAEVRRVP